ALCGARRPHAKGARPHDDSALCPAGSDQHRGWFHSSLLAGVGVQGAAPYRQVITHGVVLSAESTPYSKSELEKARQEGRKTSYVPPDVIAKKYGHEIFRLWAASVEFRSD